jgi:hypothetical protein
LAAGDERRVDLGRFREQLGLHSRESILCGPDWGEQLGLAHASSAQRVIQSVDLDIKSWSAD